MINRGIARKTFLNSNLTILLFNWTFLFSLFIFTVYQIQFCNVAVGQERLAVISKVAGDVKVQHEGQWLEVKMIGSRVMNSSLFEGDTIKTGQVSSADILYDDGSLIKIEANTSIDFRSRALLDTEKAEMKKEVGRIVKLTGGKLIFNITPSKTVLTEFETPTGVASVRGTQGSISFVIDTLTATYVLNEGLLSHDGNVYSFDMGAGLIISIQTTRGAAGQILTTINVLEGNATIITTAGIEIGLDAGDTVGITTYIDESGNPTGIETIEQTSGNSTMRTNTGTTNLATGNIVTITVQGGIEKINIEEGIIDFTNNDGDSTTIRPDDPPIQNRLPKPPAAGPGGPENPLLPMPVPTAEVPQNLADEADDEHEDPGTPTGPAG